MSGKTKMGFMVELGVLCERYGIPLADLGGLVAQVRGDNSPTVKREPVTVPNTTAVLNFLQVDAALDKLGKTLEWLADAVGVTKTTMHNWRNFTEANPSLRKAQQIAAVLRMPVASMVYPLDPETGLYLFPLPSMDAPAPVAKPRRLPPKKKKKRRKKRKSRMIGPRNDRYDLDGSVLRKFLETSRKGKKGRKGPAWLARQIGVHVSSIQNWLMGKHKISGESLRRIAVAFDVPAETFIKKPEPTTQPATQEGEQATAPGA